MRQPSALIGLLLLYLVAPRAWALEHIEFTVASLQGPGITLEGVRLLLSPLSGKRARLEVNVQRLTLEGAGRPPGSARLLCPNASFEDATLRCDDGRLDLAHPWLAGKDIRVSLAWRPLTDYLHMSLDGLRMADARWHLQATLDGRQWRLRSGAEKVRLASVQRLLKSSNLLLLPVSWDGYADLTLDVESGRNGHISGNWSIAFSDLSWADANDAYIAEGLAGRIAGSASRGADGSVRFNFDSQLAAGAMLTPYIYIEPGDKPIDLRLDAALDQDGSTLQVRRLTYAHPDVLQLTASGGFALAPFAVKTLALDSRRFEVDTLYRRYFQPLLSATLLADVQWRGHAQLIIATGQPEVMRVTLRMDDLGLADTGKQAEGSRFAIHGVSGELYWVDKWAGQDPIAPSRLQWDGGQLLGALDFGAAQWEATLAGRGFTMTKPLRLPLLDGRLIVDRLSLRAPEAKALNLEFDGFLTPVSMQRLSSAFGWPPLQGTLSGMIPGLTLADDRLSLDGNLLVRAFDGDILIRRLALGDPFGPLPTLDADVEIRDLDLQTLTGAFSFGKITGRLAGRVDNLHLEDWRPVSFDARFATPSDDASDHFISQRAVDNISNLGGAGIGGSLSRTFLGIFEQFRYDRLGISCRLRDGVCHMDGIAPAEQGYYLVIGSGIPQINIKGFTRQTDWRRLVEQLSGIGNENAPVIELNTSPGG